MKSLNFKENKIRKRETWLTHIDNWKASGLSQADFCRQNKLKPSQFTYWKYSLAKKTSEKPTFVEVPANVYPTSQKPSNTACLKLVFESGMTMEINDGFNPDTLKSIVQTLRSL